MAVLRDSLCQTKAAEELRAAVASLEKDVQTSADAIASLEKVLNEQQENERQSTLKVICCKDAEGFKGVGVL